MEQQARILRSFLAQLRSKEAEEEGAESGFTGEFLVSFVSLSPLFGRVVTTLLDSKLVTSTVDEVLGQWSGVGFSLCFLSNADGQG